MKKLIFSLLILSIFAFVKAQEYKYPFQNPKNPVNERINDLINRLSIEEKASLMLYNSPAIERLGIAEYNWWNECLHGVGRAGKATVFPQAIGMAATFDDDLIFKVATAISDEARAKHYAALRKGSRAQYTGLSFWTPNINIFRDPRWGRGQETYGEDPYLTGRMGSAFVRGLQGNDPNFLKASACAKHYVIHSGPEESRHRFNAKPDETDFRETYLPAFKTLVGAGVESIMCAYNRAYDKPCCSSKYLLDDILRKEWGFKGHIVSDCWALDDIWARHKVTDKRVKAAAMAADAGVDLNCGYLYQYLPEAVKKGFLKEEIIDKNLRYLLRTRFKLGLFDPMEQTPWSGLSEDVVNCKKHQELAYETAAKSMVLLKNNGVLPINQKQTKKIFVTGALAADITALLGNYNGFSGNMITILEGIVGKADAGTTIEYSQGFLLGNDTLFNGFWQAGSADYIIACVGINRLMEGENGDAMLNPNGGDRKTIELPGNQIEFIKKLKASFKKNKTKKLIVVVNGGSAIALKEVADLADAIIFAWYPGEQGGNALADILFGKINPSGRLPVTFYKSTKDLPPFDDYAMQGRTYKYFKGKTLYPFGYGLSYTEFDYRNLQIDKNRVKQNDTINISLDIANTNKYNGEDIVQVYVKQLKADKYAPNKVLVNFKRVSVEKAKMAKLKLQIPVASFARWDAKEKKYLTPSGKYLIQIGKSSENIVLEQEISVR
jgi:beta-glucosidase